MTDDTPEWVHTKIAYHKTNFKYHNEQAHFHSHTMKDLANVYNVRIDFDEEGFTAE